MTLPYLISVDIGGTFTDLIGFEPASGRIVLSKAHRARIATAIRAEEESHDEAHWMMRLAGGVHLHLSHRCSCNAWRYAPFGGVHET